MTAYVIAHTSLTNEEKYLKEFIPASIRSHKAHNVEIVVRTNAIEALSGQAPQRMVVLKFRDMDHARAWYHSTEQQQAIQIAKECTTGITACLVPGFEEAAKK
jgi:uncharacterized protein (DUF1330 family)